MKSEKSQQLGLLLQNNEEQDPQLLERNLKLPTQMCQEGRQLMKQQKYLEASKSFSKSIMSFEFLLKNNHLTKQRTKQLYTQIIIPAYSNLALCYLKFQDYQSVIPFCNQILTFDNQHVKARFRRGLAYLHLKRYDSAIEDFTFVGKIDEQIKNECQKKIAECKKAELQERKRQKRMAAAFIGQEREKFKSQVVDLVQMQTKVGNQKVTIRPQTFERPPSFIQKYSDWISRCCPKQNTKDKK